MFPTGAASAANLLNMGIGFVLIIWAFVGSILAGIGLLAFGGLAAFFTRGVPTGRRKAIVTAGLFPFGCLAWAGIVFLFQAIINEGVLHRDCGLGDGWHCPLPNGYQILMIDVTDQGMLYNPKTQPNGDGVMSREDAVFRVRTLQVDGPIMLGGIDSQALQHRGAGGSQIDSYFVLDSRNGKTMTFPNSSALARVASQLGIGLKLEPIYTVYSRYRFTWFDPAAGLLLVLPPITLLGLMIRWIVRLRRTRGLPTYVASGT